MTEATTRTDLIESKIDKQRSGEISLSLMGGLELANLAEAFEIAKAMAISGPCVPKYLQNNPGSCLYHVMRAARWRMDPFAIAEDSYTVKNKRSGDERISYGSRTIHAVIERNAPIKRRLSCTYQGEGLERKCTVKGIFTDGEEREYESPTVGSIRARKREGDAEGAGGAGSPLWFSDPDQQLFYHASRAWARKWCPDVLLGAFSREELAEEGFEEIPAKDLVRMPAAAQMAHEESLSTRLSPDAARRAGFNVENVVATIEAANGGAKTLEPPKEESKAEETADVAAQPAADREEPAQPTAPAIKQPTAPEFPDEASYTAHVSEILASATSVTAVKAAYSNPAERALRRRPWVTDEMLATWEAMREARIAELKGGA